MNVFGSKIIDSYHIFFSQEKYDSVFPPNTFFSFTTAFNYCYFRTIHHHPDWWIHHFSDSTILRIKSILDITKTVLYIYLFVLLYGYSVELEFWGMCFKMYVF